MKKTISLVKNTFSNLLSNYKFFYAIRKSFEDMSPKSLRSDIMAGIIVGIVAIPLSMSLAISTGVSPQYGLYTACIAGIVVAILGGSRTQVTGPTAAFIALLYPIVLQYGLQGLLLCGLLAGGLLVVMGLSGMGRLVQFIPYPVTIGFTSGIALVIFSIQLNDLFGLHLAGTSHFTHRMVVFFQNIKNLSPLELSGGGITILSLLIWPKINKKIPAPIVVLPLVTAFYVLLAKFYPELQVSTILNTFTTNIQSGAESLTVSGIPGGLPKFSLPWNDYYHSGKLIVVDFVFIKSLILPAFSVAILAAIESLLTAVVADGMAKTKHHPDTELTALGIGNLIVPFFGGIAATGALARTSTNIKFGARSPLAAVVHGTFIITALLFIAPIISYLPMSSLAALLIFVAYNMSEWKRFVHIVKVGAKSDIVVLLSCFILTVIFDMVIGVAIGIVLAALLFMRRTIDLTKGEIFSFSDEKMHNDIPDGVVVYQIIGPMFFGVADKVVACINEQYHDKKAFILLMDHVWSIDMTALVSLDNTLNELLAHDLKIVLVQVRPQPLKLISKSKLIGAHQKNIYLAPTLDDALHTLKNVLH